MRSMRLDDGIMLLVGLPGRVVGGSMRAEDWIVLVTAILVGLPALWIIFRTVTGPPRIEPTFWCELPPGCEPGFHVVVALSARLEDRVPSTVQELRAVSVALAGQPVGLVLDPGEFWLYAVPIRGHDGNRQVGMIEAVDTVFAVMRSDPTAIVCVAPEAVTVVPRARG